MCSVISKLKPLCYAGALLLLSAANIVTAAENDSALSSLSLQQILSNTLMHHPKTAVLEAKVETMLAKELQAEGAFDWQIEHNQQNRGSGYYDGWFAEQRLSRQLPFANGKIEAGYRASDGSLPVYEEYQRTLDAGEPNLKLSVSLLRNRVIDPQRQALEQASLGVELEQQLQNLSLNDLLQAAANTYLDWHQSHQELQVAQELLKLAEKRNRGIRQRVSNGDLAKVVALEFETTLIARMAKVTEAQQKVELASLRLRLYQRDDQGQLVDIATPMYPTELDSLELLLDKTLANLDIDIQQHPSLQAINLRSKQLQTQQKLSETSLLPKLDVNMRLARDLGDGPENLEGNESYLGLKFSVPIERRKAKGKLRAVKAELKALQLEQQQIQENLNNTMLQQQSLLQNQKELLALHSKQAKLARELARVEVQRFRAGDSDLFVLNAREIASAETQLRVAQTYTGILRQKIRVLAQVGRLPQFVEQL